MLFQLLAQLFTNSGMLSLQYVAIIENYYFITLLTPFYFIRYQFHIRFYQNLFPMFTRKHAQCSFDQILLFNELNVYSKKCHSLYILFCSLTRLIQGEENLCMEGRIVIRASQMGL
jgi:hypothetical protein